MIAYRVAGVLAVGLYAASLALPAATGPGWEHTRGWDILLLGWMGPLELQFGWFANPLVAALATTLIAGRRVWAWPAAATAALALTSLTWREQMEDNGVTPIHPEAGWIVWLMACCLPLAARLLVRRRAQA